MATYNALKDIDELLDADLEIKEGYPVSRRTLITIEELIDNLREYPF